MIEIQLTAAGVVLPVKAQPGAKKNAITGEHAGMLKVAVTAPPEDGKANAAIIELLAGELGISKSNIELISGATHRHKRFLIVNVEREQLPW